MIKYRAAPFNIGMYVLYLTSTEKAETEGEVNMASESNSIWKAYRFPIILLTAIVIGCIVGAVMGKDALVFKPLGDVFINAMFMVVVPLVFSTICSAVANMSSMERLGKVMKSLVIVFLVTGAIAAVLMLVTVTFFPLPQERTSSSRRLKTSRLSGRRTR